MKVYESRKYKSSLRKLENNTQRLVKEAIDRALANTQSHSNKQLEAIQGYPSIFKIRSGDYRVIVDKRIGIWAFRGVGHRNDIYNHLPSLTTPMDYDKLESNGEIQYYEPSPPQSEPIPEPRKGTSENSEAIKAQKPTLPSNGFLSKEGFSENDLHYELKARFPDINDKQISIITHAEHMGVLFTACNDGNITSEMLETAQLMKFRGFDKWKKNIHEVTEYEGQEYLSRGTLFQIYTLEEFREMMTNPIEDWMISMHPEQQVIVDNDWKGASKVSGGAGTGKTVVALRRAAKLAEQFRTEDATLFDGNKPKNKILVTTHMEHHSEVLQSLYERIPGTHSNEVEFRHIHGIADEILKRNGLSPNWDRGGKQAHSHFEIAKKDIEAKSGKFKSENPITDDYIKAEITDVILGLDIRSLKTYQEHARNGRHYKFGKRQREWIWHLHEAWQEQLSKRNRNEVKVLLRPVDRLIKALEFLEKEDEPSYRSIIIDEFQDTPLVGLKMLRKLVNTQGPIRRNQLMLVGDRGQRVFTGYCKLADAGIYTRGRSRVLTKNYRNSQQIIDFAITFLGDKKIEDDDGFLKRSDALQETSFDGSRPKIKICENSTTQGTQWILEQINALHEQNGISYGDMILLHPWGSGNLAQKKDALKKAAAKGNNYPNLSFELLDDYVGTHAQGVRIGSYVKAKGLEAKVVILPNINEILPSEQKPNESKEEYQERLELEFNQFWVAVTRARDHLLMTTVKELPQNFPDVAKKFVKIS